MDFIHTNEHTSVSRAVIKKTDKFSKDGFIEIPNFLYSTVIL